VNLRSPDRRRFLQAVGGLLAFGGASVAAETRIRLALNGHFPPLNFFDDQQQLHGLLVDELRLMASAAGVTLDFVDLPWARGQQMVRRGELDALCTIPTRERRSYALFAPTPLFVEESVLICRADDRRITANSTPDDIQGLKIAEPLGTGWVKDYFHGSQVVWSSDVDNILSMIEAGRVDGTFFGRSGAAVALAGFAHADRLRMVSFPMIPHDEGYCFGLRKTFPGAADLVARIDGVLKEQTASGAFDAIRARYLPHD